MSFNEPAFAPFLLIVLTGFLLLPHGSSQRAWLLLASYAFYGWWDPRFLIIILFSSAVDYSVGLALGRAERPSARRQLLLVSLTANLGLLGTLKYSGFATRSVATLCGLLGLEWAPPVHDVLLPLGISFYTFQSLSYTVDVYRRRIPVERSPLRFFLFVAAFPQLVAGPIVRARDLLPQLRGDMRRLVDVSGVFYILYGLLKKVVLADVIACRLVDPVFADPGRFGPASLLLAAYGYAFLIFLDFSAYTDIARGCGRLLGLELPQNFMSPYLSANPREFWQRWHISLSTWLRDYLYIGLGGNRRGTPRTYVNLLVTMLLGGLWHGAAWRFVVWGALHGLYLVVYRRLVPEPTTRLGRVVMVIVFFQLTCVAWVFFRAQSIELAWEYLYRLVTFSPGLFVGLAAAPQLVAAVLLHHFLEPRLEAIARWSARVSPPLLAGGCVVAFSVLVLLDFYNWDHRAFIYFQF